MARIVILLLSSTIILNGMTFLVVVNQTPTPGEAEKANSATASGRPGSPSPSVANPKLDSVERMVRSINSDVRVLVRGLSTLEKKVSTLEGKVNQVAVSALSRPVAQVPVEDIPPASPGDREFEYSQVPVEEPGAVDPEGSEIVEPAEEEIAPDAGVAPEGGDVVPGET